MLFIGNSLRSKYDGFVILDAADSGMVGGEGGGHRFYNELFSFVKHFWCIIVRTE